MSKTVLIAEDDMMIHHLLRDYLVEKGLSVVAVTHGAAALEECGKQVPDLLLLDLMMPGIDGMETLKEVRKLYPDLPVVILSNVFNKSDVQKCEQLGAKDYILKGSKDIDGVWDRIAPYLS